MIVSPIGKKFGKYRPGDEFSFPDAAARIMIKVGKLREVGTTAALVAKAPAKRAPARRTYKRRDMQAES